jgi:hypothetical protein
MLPYRRANCTLMHDAVDGLKGEGLDTKVAPNLRLCGGAGDENPTRTISLGS